MHFDWSKSVYFLLVFSIFGLDIDCVNTCKSCADFTDDCISTCSTVANPTGNDATYHASLNANDVFNITFTVDSKFPAFCGDDVIAPLEIEITNASVASTIQQTLSKTVFFTDTNRLICKNGGSTTNECSYTFDQLNQTGICAEDLSTCFNTFSCHNETTVDIFPFTFAFGFCRCGDGIRWHSDVGIVEPYVGLSGSNQLSVEYENYCSIYNRTVATMSPTFLPTFAPTDEKKDRFLDGATGVTLEWLLILVCLLIIAGGLYAYFRYYKATEDETTWHAYAPMMSMN